MAANQGKGKPRRKGPPALPEDLTGLELEARRAARLRTAETLRGERTPLRVLEMVEQATAVAEDAVRGVMKKHPPPPSACKEGCDWCCYCRVGTSAPEVIRIAAYLRQTLSPEALDATRQRVARLVEQRRQLKSVKRADPRLPCALLVEHRCAAYPVRPLTCRGFNSSDAHQCELFLQAPASVTVPVYVPQLRLNTFVLDGVRAGAEEAGLRTDLLELTAALRIALEVPDAAERWLAGEPVFAPARLD